MTRPSYAAYVLAGPTAIGKTEVAHAIARRTGWPILSADAMLVYRGMDIGTAKPTPAERAGLCYGGLDLVTPDQPFSVGAYLEQAHAFLATLSPDQPVLIAGGTGLYIKALLYGLDPMPPVDPAVRQWVSDLERQQGIEGLRRACAELDPARYDALRDEQNPRRVARALELARMGVPYKGVWQNASVDQPAITVLQRARTDLEERITTRVDRMMAAGLADEVAGLMARYPVWSRTAAAAIGYREMRAVLEGTMDRDTARAATITRTRQLVKKQGTWFRHQLPHRDLACDGKTVAEVAALVEADWSTHGSLVVSGG
jgi:tRNA dimethylallyltransferase